MDEKLALSPYLFCPFLIPNSGWIKTQPLKQWDVAREFRRRLKIAFDEAGVPIPLPQQEIWFNRSLPAKSQMDEHESHSPV
ncbi:mechanosensitive ion channel family protein [Trichocoleus sp. Lan]